MFTFYFTITAESFHPETKFHPILRQLGLLEHFIIELLP